MSKKKKKSEADPEDMTAVNREDCDCPCHWMPRWIRRPRFMRGWEWEDTTATLAVLTAAACSAAAFKLGQQERASEISEAVTGNQPIVVAISTNDSDGAQEQGTGILISDHLVLTSHMGLPSRDSARDGQIVLRSVGSSITTPNKWPSSSTVLTRKLLPQRLFLTNPALGLTIVACEPVTSNLPPREYEIPRASKDALKLGCSVYVLGQVQHDDREGLLMFGEGLISKEDEQVIEFYSLDGYVWAPGSAGFDAKGTFAFVVGDRRPPPKVSSPLRRRWSYAMSKGPGSRQPGILIHAVRDWTKDTWSGDFSTLLQLSSSGPTSSDLEQKAEEEKLIEQQRALSRRIDQIQNSMRDDRERLFAAAGPLNRPVSPKIGAIRCGRNLYGATDSTSRISSPIARIQEIPVQACFHSVPVIVPSSSLNTNAQSLTLKHQSPPALGGIAALAAEELERYDDEIDLVAEITAASKAIQDCPDGSVDVDFNTQQESVRDVTPICASPEHESRSPKSPKSPSCWFSTWWRNFRPTSSQMQRRQAVADSATAERANREEEVMTDCLEPNSPPRRFLVRGTYTATPRREFSSSQSSFHILNPESANPTSPRDSCCPLEGMSKPFSPRNQRPCKCTPKASPRSLSPEIPYLQIHRSPTGGCPRQSDIPWKPNGQLDSRRILPPPDPPRMITGVARTRTHPRDYCPPRSEDEQKKLDEAGERKVSAGFATCVKVEELPPQQSDATVLQDRIIQSPIAVLRSPPESCGENENLDSGLSSYLVDSPASQRARIHDVPEVDRKILPDSIRQISLMSRKTSVERVIEITCFQRWKKFVTRKKNMAVESMRSLFSPRTVYASAKSSRSISPIPGTSHNLEEPAQAIAAAGAAYFVGSPLSTHNGSGCPPMGRQEQAPPSSFYGHSSHAQMPNWATKQHKIQDESPDLSTRQVSSYEGREEESAVEAAAAQVKIWNGSCIPNLSQQNESGAEVPSPRPGPPSTPFTEASRSSREACTEKYMMMKKEKTDQQRKEIGVQRPRWSIAKVDKGPLVIGSVLDPLDDSTKCKSKMKRQPLVNNAGGVSSRGLVSQEEGTVLVHKRKTGGVRDLANEPEVEHEERQTGARPPSPSKKRSVNTNSNGKQKTWARNSADERSTSQSKQPLRSTSKRLLEAPIAKRGSSVGSSSSDREGRPRWRCP